VGLIAARLRDGGLVDRVLTEFSRLGFMNTSFVSCHNPGPRIYNLDTTFAMPAVLMEMLVYSKSGLVEILPALPQDRFDRGTLRGLLARGGIVVEELHWNMTLQRVSVTVRSARPQSIKLRFGVPVRFVNAADPADKGLVGEGDGKRGWRVELPAGKPVRLRCAM
jgi:alpha-L-fucosidase 2